MKAILVLTAVLATTGVVTVRSQNFGSAADRESITAMLGRWEQAWNTHDMTAFASLFHDDGVWILWTGDVWSGRRVIEEGHAAVHKTIFRNSKQLERLAELTFVGPDAAIVRFCSIPIGSDQSPDQPIRSRKFLVVTRRQGAWKISWGQNTRLRDTVPDSECFTELRKRGGPVAQPTSTPASVADAFAHAWNVHDGPAFGRLYANDADWVMASGQRLRGREAIEAALTKEHASWARSTVLKSTDVAVRELDRERAIVMLKWEIMSGTDAAAPPFRGNTMMVVTQQGQGWLITAGQVAAAPR